MEYGEFPKNASNKDRILLRSLAKRFFIFNRVLYKRDKALHLRCVSEKEAEQIIWDVHSGVCGPHMNGKKLARIIMRQGYYWLIKEHDFSLSEVVMSANCMEMFLIFHLECFRP